MPEHLRRAQRARVDRMVVGVYEAPDEETVRRHSQKLGSHYIEEVFEIAGDVTPADFPPSPA